jgi:hypothetical protein
LNYVEKVSSSLSNAILDLHSFAVNKLFPIDDVETLREDLHRVYILNKELKNFTVGLARVCGTVWSLFEITPTTVKLS